MTAGRPVRAKASPWPFIGMAGMAERYWKELRPSSAGRSRLDAAIRHDREDAGRNPRRLRHHSRPKLRATSR